MQLNLQINALAFADRKLSNNPSIRNFDLVYKLMGISINNPYQQVVSIQPGEEVVLHDGIRTTSIDGTTAFDVTRPFPTENVFRFTSTAGTSPDFRTDRASGITNSTIFAITVNGPVTTLTATTGPFVTTNIQVGDILKIESGSGFNATALGDFVIIAKASNSVSFKNVNGVAIASVPVVDATKIYIYSNGGGTSNQVQPGDKVIISSGFSLATQGIYEVSDVTPNWFEITFSAAGGIPLETDIIPTATGLVFYKQAKSFILAAATNTVSVKFNNNTDDTNIIEAVEVDNPDRPGIFMKNGSFYKLAIKNISIYPVQVTVATAE